MQFSKTGCLETYLKRSIFDNGKSGQIGASSTFFKSMYNNFLFPYENNSLNMEYLKHSIGFQIFLVFLKEF